MIVVLILLSCNGLCFHESWNTVDDYDEETGITWSLGHTSVDNDIDDVGVDDGTSDNGVDNDTDDGLNKGADDLDWGDESGYIGVRRHEEDDKIVDQPIKVEIKKRIGSADFSNVSVNPLFSEKVGAKGTIRFSWQIQENPDKFINFTLIFDSGGVCDVNLSPKDFKRALKHKLITQITDEIYVGVMQPGVNITVREAKTKNKHSSMFGLPFFHKVGVMFTNDSLGKNIIVGRFPGFFSKFKNASWNIYPSIYNIPVNDLYSLVSNLSNQVTNLTKEIQVLKNSNAVLIDRINSLEDRIDNLTSENTCMSEDGKTRKKKQKKK